MNLTKYKRVGLGATVRFLHYNLGIMDSKYRNDLSTHGDKAAYMWPSPDLTVVGASCTKMPF